MENKNNDQITRKEAIKKMGKYAALTAAGTFLILNPLKAQTESPPPGGGDSRNGNGGDGFDELFQQ